MIRSFRGKTGFVTIHHLSWSNFVQKILEILRAVNRELALRTDRGPPLQNISTKSDRIDRDRPRSTLDRPRSTSNRPRIDRDRPWIDQDRPRSTEIDLGSTLDRPRSPRSTKIDRERPGSTDFFQKVLTKTMFRYRCRLTINSGHLGMKSRKCVAEGTFCCGGDIRPYCSLGGRVGFSRLINRCHHLKLKFSEDRKSIEFIAQPQK